MAMLSISAGKEDNDDQTNITWTDPNYPHALTRYTALHYFEMSPFFDPNCNNTLARQQGRDPAVIGALEFVAPQGGLEYVVDMDQPPHLFVIRKQIRRGQDTSIQGAVSLLTIYYILDKVIYQAPSLHAAITSRIRRCIWSLHQGFDKLKVDLDPLVRLMRAGQDKQAKVQAAAAAGIKTEPAATSEQQAADSSSAAAAEASTSTVFEPLAGLTDFAGEPDVVEEEGSIMSKPSRVTQEEAAYWKRTDNIILTVLSSYKVPEMPSVYYQQQAADQQAATGAQGLGIQGQGGQPADVQAGQETALQDNMQQLETVKVEQQDIKDEVVGTSTGTAAQQRSSKQQTGSSGGSQPAKRSRKS